MAPCREVPSLEATCKITLQRAIIDITLSLYRKIPAPSNSTKMVETLQILLGSFLDVPECHHACFSKICLLALETLYSFVGPLSEESFKLYEEVAGLLLCALSNLKSVSIDLDKWEGKIVSNIIVGKLIEHFSKFGNLKVFSSCGESDCRKESLPGKVLSACSFWSRLTSFTLWEVCSDQILSEMTKNCPSVKEIDVTNSSNVTDASVDSLKSFKKLQVINLADTSVSPRGLSEFFLRSTSDDLFDIRLRSFNQMEAPMIQKTLDIMAKTLRNEGPILPYRPNQIRRFLCLVDPQGLKLLCKYFPNISELSVMFDVDSSDLTVSHQFERLEKFDLITGFYPSQQFNKCSSVITSFELIYCEQEFLDEFMHIIPSMCPNIETLQFSAIQECEFGTEFVPAIQPRVKPFQKLKSIIWTSFFCTPYADYILRHAENIETIETTTECTYSHPNCDGLFESVLQANPLRQLRDLGSEYPQDFVLSIETVMHLISSCEKLKFINCVLRPNTFESKKTVESFIRKNNYAVAFMKRPT